MDVNEFHFLWDGTEKGWVLVHENWADTSSKGIYNTETEEFVLIENSALEEAVLERMIAEQVAVLDEPPPERPCEPDDY